MWKVREKKDKYFDCEEIFGRAVKGDSPRNRTSGDASRELGERKQRQA